MRMHRSASRFIFHTNGQQAATKIIIIIIIIVDRIDRGLCISYCLRFVSPFVARGRRHWPYSMNELVYCSFVARLRMRRSIGSPKSCGNEYFDDARRGRKWKWISIWTIRLTVDEILKTHYEVQHRTSVAVPPRTQWVNLSCRWVRNRHLQPMYGCMPMPNRCSMKYEDNILRHQRRLRCFPLQTLQTHANSAIKKIIISK